jgi:uncharacterized membrane protein YfcA
MPIEYLWLLPLGLLVGAFGTLIGAGGGFILMPVLLLVYPRDKTELITAISLAVVFFNALSGSFAYARMKRVDYKSGIPLHRHHSCAISGRLVHRLRSRRRPLI